MNVGSTSLLASNLFTKLDTKQQGYIEQSDMQSAFDSLSSTDSSTDVSEVFTQLDADSDGKLTQTELSDGIQSLVDALQTQLQQSRFQGSSDGMQMPPPPPPGAEGVDEGFTQDELSSMATDSTTDSKRATLMSELAANFDAADTDGNGKINRDEAMAYDQSQSTTATAATSSDSTSSAESLDLQAMTQLLQLLQAYGSSSTNSTTSSVSLAA